MVVVFPAPLLPNRANTSPRFKTEIVNHTFFPIYFSQMVTFQHILSSCLLGDYLCQFPYSSKQNLFIQIF